MIPFKKDAKIICIWLISIDSIKQTLGKILRVSAQQRFHCIYMYGTVLVYVLIPGHLVFKLFLLLLNLGWGRSCAAWPWYAATVKGLNLILQQDQY